MQNKYYYTGRNWEENKKKQKKKSNVAEGCENFATLANFSKVAIAFSCMVMLLPSSALKLRISIDFFMLKLNPYLQDV